MSALDWALIGKESLHPLQRQILASLDRANPTLAKASPTEIAEEFGEPLGNVSYHMRALEKHRWVELVDTKPRRGALEHFYSLSPRVLS